MIGERAADVNCDVSVNVSVNVLFVFAGMLLVCGGLVNGPYALITTAVSADLVMVFISTSAPVY